MVTNFFNVTPLLRVIKGQTQNIHLLKCSIPHTNNIV